MIQHPYVVHGRLDREANEAAMHRAAFYGTAGFVDPKAHFVDPFFFRRGSTWGRAWIGSMYLAAATGLVMATAGYMGFDPLNVTPGYGLTLDSETSFDRLGQPIDYFERPSRHWMM